MFARGVCFAYFALMLVTPPQTTEAHGARLALQYEPAVIEISGKLLTRTYPGPPNYESVRSGDRPETCWILHLTEPADVVAADADDLNESEPGVREVQLAFLSDKKYPSLLRPGRKVNITGRLFSAHTGHHHTKVLVEVIDMRRGTDEANDGRGR